MASADMRADADLVSAAHAGDPRAMSALLVQLRPDIRRYAAYQCGRATALDDVVQEALIIVNRSLGSVDNLAAFGAWLARVVARLCLLPPLRLLRATESLLTMERRVDFSARPPDELRSDLVRALDSLPESYRAVIVMRDFEELTIAELAARLGLSVAATKSRLHRARALVREYLLGGPDAHPSDD
jgi:RNA polymerase sigma-70 factor (ECF subfamily)